MKRLVWVAAWVVLGVSVARAGDVLEWEELPPLPDGHIGVAGPFAGVSNDALIVAGGANFPNGYPWDGGEKVWYAEAYVLEKTGDGAYAWRTGFALERPLAYGASVTTEDGVVCIGGCDAERCYADCFVLNWDEDAGQLVRSPLPALPAPCAFTYAAKVGDVIYVTGGQCIMQAPMAMKNFWALDLAAENLAWKELPPWPGQARVLPIAVAQSNGVDDCLYLFSGRYIAPGEKTVFHKDTYCYNPIRAEWKRLADAPRATCAGMGAAMGSAHVMLFGGADGSNYGKDLRLGHPGFPKDVLAYHTVTDTWTRTGAMPEAQVTTVAVKWDDAVVIPSGEIHPGIRSPKVWRGSPIPTAKVFGAVNYAVLGLYLVVLVGMGFYFARREKSTQDFFLAGRRIPWWAAGLSIFGTQLSAITFMAIPAKVYATDWRYFLGNMCIVLVAPAVVFLYLPFYRRLNVTTAYEYLERRFNVGVRLLGSVCYILLQLGRMAIVLFLPALALEAVTGIDVYVCILVMGVLCTIYTVLGGIEAVIWTDVLQVVVLMGGALLSLLIIVGSVDGGFAGIAEVARADAKLRVLDWRWDCTMPVVWVVVVGQLLSNLVPYTADQTVVQRYLTTKDEKAAARSIWTNAFLTVPASLLFFALGTALYVFYKSHPADLSPMLARTDSLLPWFIVRELPVGVSGLVIAGVFAASMSSMDSSINSAATAITTDFYRRFRPAVSDQRCLRLARVLTVVLGVVGTGTAMVMAGGEIKSLWDQFMRILGLFGGSLAGLFVLGIFTRRAHGTGAFIGAVVSALVLYVVQQYTPLHFFLYAAVGILSCLVVGYVMSLVVPAPERSLEGLTIYTLPRRDEASV